MLDIVKEKYDLAPSDPGVYLMKDNRGQIIYVGKAKNLKKRLSSYFVRESGHALKTTLLVKNIVDFDVIVTATEHEALILEATLIKKHKPKYNVFLKDGKNYPCFRIDTKQNYPLLQLVRKIKNDGAAYFGPYSSGESVKKVLKQVNRIFQLRKCRDNSFKHRSRPCIQFQIKACLAPCCNDVPVELYKKMVNDVMLFLKGRTQDLIKQLKQEMTEEANKQEFEKAAKIRDTIFAIEKSLEQQIVASKDMMDRDVVACVGKEGRAVVTILFVRSGYVVGTEHYPFDLELNLHTLNSNNSGCSDTAYILEAFLKQYYQIDSSNDHKPIVNSNCKLTTFIPSQILVAEDFEDRTLLEETLSAANSRKVSILVPEKGEKRRIVEMAINNAKREFIAAISKNSESRETLLTLQRILEMERYPERIECFDNSNISGTAPVSSMVVFINGEPAKSLYRKFIIKNVDKHDDYSYMAEVLRRRFAGECNYDSKKNESADSHIESKIGNDFPNILVVDGGKGQLSIALAVLDELKLEKRELKEKIEAIKVIGIAKKDSDKGETHDKVYVQGRSNPLNMVQSQDKLKALHLLQRLRDEAHRFAITFQRQRREKLAETSILDNIPGVGKKRKIMLLNHFKGITDMKKATVKEIAALPNMPYSVAENLVKSLK
ncbi:MAG: excinuclease ABC subunit UvrC [Desulfamplus sp.]|nr:excinuclease ABC subunit UvrC [Desulfamplus sp.]